MVPETVIAVPGAKVCPGATAKAVVPSFIVALIVSCPLIVRAGVGLGRVEEVPSTTMIEPDAAGGMEKVVPETVTAVPGASVWPGATTKAVVPSLIDALILF